MSQQKIEHVFILMLENHSFDNVFGASGIAGISGLNGDKNSYLGTDYPAGSPAPDALTADPGHEFTDTLQQLCGNLGGYEPFQDYPSEMNNSGFVKNFATSRSEDHPFGSPPTRAHWGDVMRCFDTPNQLPVIYQLATEFAICDRWFSSMPGPTFPNRLFAYGASSGSLDDSPSIAQMAIWNAPGGGIQLPRGSIFDRLRQADHPFRIYQDKLSRTSFPLVLALAGISYAKDLHHLDDFEADLKSGDYRYPVTLIEPDYGKTTNGSFRGGSSQHPMDGMHGGEELIKRVYERIRSVEAIWEKSLLVVTYDEHGGFYDSADPPAAKPPGDIGHPGGPLSTNGFLFDRLGIRVPAVVVSPWIPKGTVSHTVFDHTSILKTVEELLDLDSLTDRDEDAESLMPLLTETRPRTDCPKTLAASAEMSTEAVTPLPSAEEQARLDEQPLPERGNIWGFLAIAAKVEHELSGGTEGEREEIRRRYLAIETLGHARRSMESALAKMRDHRA